MIELNGERELVMRFAAMFFDDLDPSSLDADLTRRHFDYLRDNRAQIALAGGLRRQEGAAFCGSLWIVEAANLEEAVRLVDGDPYCVAGLRPDRRVFIWNHAPIPAASN
jgi:uncharacterized protein YciI